MNTSPASLRSLLKERASALRRVRSFFEQRSILEVDCPALSDAACIDQHIDVMKVDIGDGKQGFLHTSPEYGMKQLLAQGSGDIYQLSHVFRAHDQGPRHHPEFTMLEWYRQGFSLTDMIAETIDCIRLLLGPLPIQVQRYRDLFRQFLNLDPHQASVQQLFAISGAQGLELPSAASTWDQDTLLQALLGLCIEPYLGADHLFVLTHFPASQAALSQLQKEEDGEETALRFEIYYQGIELANGYQELTDPQEQRLRLLLANEKRVSAGKPQLPLDEDFLGALEQGLPDCCGVAVGFDRLLQLRLGLPLLSAVLPLHSLHR